ncbi:MAG: MBL fold metallo-hydrolase [Gemmatimonadales bacterium]|nr:MBL fold metallo-hydrolase [Gemmatimonadales bacterium]
MTRLYALGSGSRGNCFALERDGVVLLLDAGFSLRELDRRAAAAGLALDGLVGIVLTHEHGDHAAGAVRTAARHDVPLVASAGTRDALRAGSAVACAPLVPGHQVTLGPFEVAGCPIPHDATEPMAVAIRADDGTSVALAYDVGRPTAALRLLLRDRTAVILEANHDEVLLRTSPYPASVQERIAGSAGHLSNRIAAQLLAEASHAGLGTVVLAHLSQRCNSEEMARAAVTEALRAVRFGGEVVVARQDEPTGPFTLHPAHGAQFALPI